MHGAEQIIDTNTVMFAKLVLAMVLGGIIGTERAVIARQAAGTRTFGLVAMGACLFIISGNYIDGALLGIINFDPARMATGIVQGIGFLGAGLIIFRGETLHGVTTAAGLWIVAAIGTAVGLGLYQVATFATLLTLIMFTGMWYVENRFKQWFSEPHLDQSSGAQPHIR